MPAPAAAAAGPVLGVIAGGGRLPLMVADAARAAGRPVVVFGIAGEADSAIAGHRHHIVHWGEIGRLFDLLAREEVREIVIAGSVTRPDYRSIKVDLGAVLSLPKILSIVVGGDDTVLKGVVRFFEDRGYRVIGAHEVAGELVASPGLLGRVKPGKDDLADMARGFEAAVLLGRLDVGQASVAIGGRVVAAEGIEGTDAMLERVASLRRSGRLRARAGEGVLVKASKPQQDLRVDMPTIGPRTVELAAEAGLAGLAIEAGRVMVVDRSATVAAADRLGLFITSQPLAAGEGA